MSETLPQGWEATTLSDLCDFNPKHAPQTDRELAVSFIPMPSVSDTDGKILPHGTKPLNEVWKGYTHFADDDVIFAKITPCMENGKIAVARGLANGLACGSTEFHVLRSRGAVLPDYVHRYLRQGAFRSEAERTMTGAVGQRRVPADYLKSTLLPLPPLAEQKRIVAKLDALLARSTRARDELARIPRLIERYKQAVLAAAFRGVLTADWRERQDLPAITLTSNDDVPWKLPSSWAWKTVTQIGEVGLGRQRSPVNHTGPNMRPYVRAANITWNGWDFSDVKEMNFNEADFSRFCLSSGDVLVNEGSGSAKEVGKPAIWRDEIKGCCFQNTLIRVQPLSCSSEYLYFYFLFSALTERFVSKTQGVNIYHIGKEGLARYPIPLPPEAEQRKIVERLELALRKIDMLRTELTRAEVLRSRLEEATLAKAFRGELVPQDPNDEPASVLLERIRAERAANENGQKRKRRLDK